MDIICAGEMLIDFTPENEKTYTANPGGAPANVVIEAARNNLTAGFLGVMGNDDFGRLLQKTLEENRVRILCPDLAEEAVTTLAFVTLYENGERSFTFARKPGADMLLSVEDIKRNEADIADCRLFHAGSFSLTSASCCEAILEAMKLVKESRHLVSFDVNYRSAIWNSTEDCRKKIEPILPYIDLLKISDEELYFVGGKENIPAFMQKNDICVLVLTMGSRGAEFYYQNHSEAVSGMSVTCVDATGAGDAFWGAFLSKLLMSGIRQMSEITVDIIRDALQYGNVAGGLCVQKKGGIPALPYQKDIMAAIT